MSVPVQAPISLSSVSVSMTLFLVIFFISSSTAVFGAPVAVLVVAHGLKLLPSPTHQRWSRAGFVTSPDSSGAWARGLPNGYLGPNPLPLNIVTSHKYVLLNKVGAPSVGRFFSESKPCPVCNGMKSRVGGRGERSDGGCPPTTLSLPSNVAGVLSLPAERDSRTVIIIIVELARQSRSQLKLTSPRAA